MRRKLRNPLLILACGLSLVLGSLALLRNASPVGVLQTSPDENDEFAIASAVYVGNGIVLTNWHVEEPTSYFHTRRQIFRSPQSVLNISIGDRTIPVQDVLYLEADLELAVIRLRLSPLDWWYGSTPCLSAQGVGLGDQLIAVSSPYGRYPPVRAELVVSDPDPRIRLDPDPRVSNSDRHAAMTIVAVASAEQADWVGPGSSGGAVLNSRQQLVGLIWTGQDLQDGSIEVWITPASEWFTWAQDSEASQLLEALSRMVCAE